MILFLDLEETLIDSWDNGWLLPANIACIRKKFADKAPIVGLMSWAVWNLVDKQTFNKKMRKELENALGVPFNDNFIWSMSDWADKLLQFNGKKISQQDLFDCFSKHEVLFMLSRTHPEFKRHNVVLIDDAVEHELSWESKINQCRGQCLNIKELIKE